MQATFIRFEHCTDPPAHLRREEDADRDCSLAESALNEMDYPLAIVDGELRILFANREALALPVAECGVCCREQRLRLSAAADQSRLTDAVIAAIGRGLRRWLLLGAEGAAAATLAVVPARSGSAAMLIFGRRSLCQTLSIEAFGRQCGLTASETRVLRDITDGALPGEIARSRGVALSTVRTQIAALRAKTGARDLRDLLRLVATLPPMARMDGASSGRMSDRMRDRVERRIDRRLSDRMTAHRDRIAAETPVATPLPPWHGTQQRLPHPLHPG